MNSVFELLIKVWTGSRDLKVRPNFGFEFFFHTTYNNIMSQLIGLLAMDFNRLIVWPGRSAD
jgi:hypothetical protein